MGIGLERKAGRISGIHRRSKGATSILERLQEGGVYFMEDMFTP